MRESERYLGTFEVHNNTLSNVVKSRLSDCKSHAMGAYRKHDNDNIDYPTGDTIHGAVRYFSMGQAGLIILPIKDVELAKQVISEFNLHPIIDDFITWEEYSEWR